MTYGLKSKLRALVALALQATMVVYLLAAPPAGAASHGAWTEICTAEGMVRLQLDADGQPVEKAPSQRGHDLCDLCLPPHAGAPPALAAMASLPLAYQAAATPVASDALTPLPPYGPPIGPRGPPVLS